MPRQLGYAQFFGSRSREHRGTGFTVALMRPDPVREVELHVHDTAHLILHLEGAYLSTAAHAPRVARHPMLVVNPPGTTHRDCYAREDGAFRGRFLSVAIDAASWEAWRPTSTTDAWCRTDVASLGAAGRLLAALRHERPEVLEGALVELLAAASPPREASPHPPPWLARALQLLRDRCTETVSVREVARACDVHPVSLARAFRRHLCTSPGEVLRQARLERAVGLLACSDFPISDIAHRCGYAHQSHLHRHVREALGLTPGAVRRDRCS